MTIEHAKILLGEDGGHLSDTQIQHLIDQLTVFTEIACNQVMEDCAQRSHSVS